jgi:hypothetical protein
MTTSRVNAELLHPVAQLIDRRCQRVMIVDCALVIPCV